MAQLSATPNHGTVFPQPHYQFDHHVHTLLDSRPPAGSPLIPFLQIVECVDADARHQQQGSKANATSIVIVIADAEVSSNVTNWSALNREDVNRHDGQASATDKSAISVTQNYRSVCRAPVDKPTRLPHELMVPMDPYLPNLSPGAFRWARGCVVAHRAAPRCAGLCMFRRGRVVEDPPL